MLINTQISDSRFGRRLLAATLQLVLLISLLISAPSQAWWDMGHAAVCDAAQGQLSPSARAVLDDLLQGERFGSACSWADRIKKKRPESRSWHYLNVDRDTSSVRLVTPPEDGDIITALKRYRAVLANAAAPRSDRAEALRFVAHFVADIHQPLHIGLAEDWGGNRYPVALSKAWQHFFGEDDRDSTRIHQVWDGYLPLYAVTTKQQSLLALTQAAMPTSASIDPIEWADESLRLSQQASLGYVNGDPLRSLNESYLENQSELAIARLGLAARRLSALLEQALVGPATADQ